MPKIHRAPTFRYVALLRLLAACALWPAALASAQEAQQPAAPQARLGIGTEVKPAYYAAWDIDVSPTGQGLPAGSGSAQQGQQLFESRGCSGCHTVDPTAKTYGYPLLGYKPLPTKTIGSYLPYATTLFDYIHRAMPFGKPQSLSDDEVYALTAYLLVQNKVLEKDAMLDANSLLAVEMPNHDGFTSPDPRPDTDTVPCMVNCPPIIGAPNQPEEP